ncbi:4-diphosphocytidyl-2-C-methyl-D-erythritolkinase [Spirochaeta thermophila DSM 6578]|uniref:4-diphosphocytidyl-2-C-methyl-D-erythritol kinase n=1 Tax=Winmispira thermophila (strain ATCC 700085 / DSM 6578 / Z-1203) TaxID=869211 RepID=G0GDJ0_WINT7|nr:4-(cytidine 5'-diphospho)-2-C-methyl-D-erythritol kinase [Spirochaeta thermophila]AEJ61337.1 4-diphosphocytidyl-2-C-methyl-D-erythritolkinase [Spirochaeta thermophila DSM 6578]
MWSTRTRGGKLWDALVLSPAKVNFHLEILDTREDGYHNIRSIFQTISIFDRIWIRSLTDAEEDVVDGVPATPEESTVHRAVRIFREATGWRGYVHVKVEKRIPSGAGLGGASSNAAAVLRVLDTLTGVGLGEERLAELGLEVGSDVPFFCRAPAALVEGRGEVIRPVKPRDDFWLLCVAPGFPISTVQAYALYDERKEVVMHEGLSPRRIVKSYEMYAPEKWGFRNAFFDVLVPRYPLLQDIVQGLGELGALYANVSGSGSVVYGVFPSFADLVRADAAMVRQGYETYRAHPLKRLPRVWCA